MGLQIVGRMRFQGKFNGVFPQIPPPTPSFTASPTTGLIPLTVNFVNTTTTASGVTYQWDFNGDGVVDSTEVNPTYTYTTTGTFSVSLTAVSTGGSITTTQTNYIVPYDTPPESLSGTAINTVGLTMAVYDDNSLIGDGVDIVPLTVYFSDQSETLIGTSNNTVPITFNSDSSETLLSSNINDVPLTMTNYVHV